MASKTDLLTQEVRSESTLPLLNFLLSCKSPKESPESVAQNLRDITASIGEKIPPIPSEAKQVKDELLGLIRYGPGKVTGNPTVSP